jgi:hypothetical protein
MLTEQEFNPRLEKYHFELLLPLLEFRSHTPQIFARDGECHIGGTGSRWRD